jgi:hypothetical protein
MVLANFTPEQQEIIRDICDIRIQSFLRVAMDNRINTTIGNLIEIKDREIDEIISDYLRTFDNLKANPNILFQLDNISISLIKTELLNNDKRYSNDPYYTNKHNLWRKLFLFENYSRETKQLTFN